MHFVDGNYMEKKLTQIIRKFESYTNKNVYTPYKYHRQFRFRVVIIFAVRQMNIPLNIL
jgi:hypothetical protein